MKTLRFCAGFLSFSVLFAAALSSDVSAAICSNVLNLPASAARETVVFTIDQTTPAWQPATASFLARTKQSLKAQRVRYVFVTFAALSRDEAPRVVFDFVHEADIPRDQSYDLAVNRLRAYDTCRRNQMEAAWQQITNAVAKLKPEGTGEYSELPYAFRWLISTFAVRTPTTIVALSDGLIHSTDGWSFYSRGNPRVIDATKELRRLQSSALGGVVEGQQLKMVHLSGVGLRSSDSKGFSTPAQQASYESFWKLAFKRWGAGEVRVGLTLH